LNIAEASSFLAPGRRIGGFERKAYANDCGTAENTALHDIEGLNCLKFAQMDAIR
jgi:hypothetical protein